LARSEIPWADIDLVKAELGSGGLRSGAPASG